MGTVICTKCKQAKPIDAFGRHSQRPCGRNCWCKACVCASAKRYASTPDGVAKLRARQQTEKYREQRSACRRRPAIQAYDRAYQRRPNARLSKVLSNQKRRARLRAGGHVSSEQGLAILEAFGRRCVYCSSAGQLTLDHVQAIAGGGEHCIANLVPACRPCNLRKNALPLPEALRRLRCDPLLFAGRVRMAHAALERGGFL